MYDTYGFIDYAFILPDFLQTGVTQCLQIKHCETMFSPKNYSIDQNT